MKDFAALAIICLSIVQCSKSPSQQRQSQGLFSNSTGNTYVYSVVDSNKHSTYNVLVSIVGTAKLQNGDQASVWVYKYPSSVDTNYVTSNADSTIMYNSSKTGILNMYFYPFVIGKQWINAWKSDVKQVASITNIVLPSGTFSGCFNLTEEGYSPNYYIKRNEIVSPLVGLLKQTVKDFHNYQVWSLVSYQLTSK